jgi:mannose-6-phosphate isomerase-like protein (cupin superfamily)
MERSAFLRALTGTAALLMASVNSVGKVSLKFREKVGYKVDAGKDRFQKPINLLEGDVFTTKISTKDTDGDLYVWESSRFKEGGPSHHFHYSQDEWWYVLKGEFTIRIGDITQHAKAGDSVFGPRMIPHSFAKVGEGEGKLLQIFQPAGKMEEFFKKISEGIAKNMTEQEQDKLREDHGFKRVGPPIKYFKKL